MDITIEISLNLSFADEIELSQLLDQCFPNIFQGNSFFKQEPHARFIARRGKHIVGQIGIDKRVVNVGGDLLKIIGLIDLCVDEQCRGKGVGTALLQAAEKHGVNREFSILMADDARLYLKSGYRRLTPAPTRWLAIDELKSHSVMEKDLSNCFMVKPLLGSEWPEGEIDLLGYLF